jgi:hypothetical protein
MLCGFSGFSCFLLEEGVQLNSFSSFAAQDVRQWQILLDLCDNNRKIVIALTWLNYGLNWINPPNCLAYHHYIKATKLHIKALEAKIFAHQPSLFENRKVEFNFEPHKIERHNGYNLLVARNVAIRVAENYTNMDVNQWSGTLKREGNMFVLDVGLRNY